MHEGVNVESLEDLVKRKSEIQKIHKKIKIYNRNGKIDLAEELFGKVRELTLSIMELEFKVFPSLGKNLLLDHYLERSL